MQQALLDLANPLDLKIGKDFFSAIPRCPGVYKMYDDDGHILYVGKAKNLRTRLMSYRRIKITSQSRKSIRLVHQVSEIKWEECLDEEAALVRENDLLRSFKTTLQCGEHNSRDLFLFYRKGRRRRCE